MDDDYEQAKIQENLSNPKNKFLFIFCHANEVDNSWGCGFSFTCGVTLFSIIIGITALCDLFYIARDKMFERASYYSNYPSFRYMFLVKVFSDFIALIGIGIACYSIYGHNYKYGIVSYYVEVVSFLLCTIFCIYCLVAIFLPGYWSMVQYRLISWGFGEFGMLLFCWILFCNMVTNSKKVLLQQQQVGEY